MNFTDTHGNDITIRTSSAAMEPCIWVGIDNPKITIFEDEKMGKYLRVNVPDTWRVDNLMHLNKENAKELINKLQHFIDTAK